MRLKVAQDVCDLVLKAVQDFALKEKESGGAETTSAMDVFNGIVWAALSVAKTAPAAQPSEFKEVCGHMAVYLLVMKLAYKELDKLEKGEAGA